MIVDLRLIHFQTKQCKETQFDSVKGKEMHPLYQFLTQKAQNGLLDSEVEWNFQKYLINEKGELVKVIKPRTLPTDPEVINWIKS